MGTYVLFSPSKQSTLKVLNFWKFTYKLSGWISASYCNLKPWWSSMEEVVPPCILFNKKKCSSASIVLASTLQLKHFSAILWHFLLWYFPCFLHRLNIHSSPFPSFQISTSKVSVLPMSTKLTQVVNSSQTLKSAEAKWPKKTKITPASRFLRGCTHKWLFLSTVWNPYKNLYQLF